MGDPTSTPNPSIDVAHVARLARLALTADEMQAMAHDLGRILGYVEALKEVDVDDVPPMSHPLPFVRALRPDEPGPVLPQAVALQSSAHADEAAFIVPKVV